MSPLARSLFALATLFVAANAMSNPFCSGLSRGKPWNEITGYTSESFVLTAKGDEVTIIPDKCTMPGRELAGDSLSVCNTPYNQPKMSTPMGIRNELGAVYIACPNYVPGCSNLELHVVQNCEPAGLPPIGVMG